ncbi:hypothetical protein ACWDTT_38685 [Streptosporangium sandarakinum]
MDRTPDSGHYRVIRIDLLGHSPILEDPPRTAASLLAFTAAHAVRAG